MIIEVLMNDYYRYSMLDAGHALGSLAVAAARLGWQITLLPNVATEDVEAILGLTEANQFTHSVERERGLILAVVSTSGNRFSPSSDFSGTFSLLFLFSFFFLPFLPFSLFSSFLFSFLLFLF